MIQQAFQSDCPTTLIEAIKWYLLHKTKMNGHRTDERIKSCFNVLTRTIKTMEIQEMPINNVNAGVITQILVRTKKDRGFGNNRFNDLHSFLNMCFRELYKNDWIRRNPLIQVSRMTKLDAEKHIPYTEMEYERIKNHLIEHEPFLWSFIEFMCFTGLRPNEIRQLTVGDISMETWTVRLRSSIAKTKKERIIKIRPEYKATIESWNLDFHSKKYFLFSNKYRGIGGRMAGKNAFSMKFFEHRELMNLTENHTLYGFRHTMALRILQENNNNIGRVQRYLGHSSMRTTINYLLKADAQNIVDDSTTHFPTI